MSQAEFESFLKEMMLALRSTILQSFTATLNKQMAVIEDLDDRVNHVEIKMEKFSTAHNGLVDAHNQLEDIKSLSAKLADLEDRNKKNNLKLRGIPESVLNAELISYIKQLMKVLLKLIFKQDLIIDGK